MTVHLLLLCHAPTLSARAGGFPLDDEPLDPDAEPRLARLRGRIRPSDRRFVSPLARATQTAAKLGLDAAREPALADADFGRWRGWTLAQAQMREPEALAAWIADPAKAPHGGESVAALIARVRGWLEIHASSRGVILAVTHAAVIRAALVAALDVEARAFWRIDVAPLAMARLSGREGRWNLVGLETPEAEV